MRRISSLCMYAMVIIFSVHAYWGSSARADSLNLSTDHQYINSSGTTKLKLTGEKLDTDYEQFNQLYNFNLSKNFWPYLVFNAGSVYQINSTWSDTGDNKVDTEETILTPYAELNLTNPIYQAGIAYRKRRIEEDVTDLKNTQADRDEIAGTLGMDPPSELFPVWTLRYSHIHTYDDPETQDETQKVWRLDTAYSPVRDLYLDYSYARTDTEEDLLNFDTTQQTHIGNVQYFRNFLNQRLFMDSSYTINYNKFDISSGSGGAAEIPILRFAGLSSLDNTPEDGPALAVNPALIDGNLTASAGLDIGTAGDQIQPVNIGLDFGFEVNVDTLYVWVDRRLTDTVVNSFSWDVYTSPDNTDLSTWTLVATVAPANFGQFDNRFEISFPQVNTRFIKVVTAALSPVVPGAGTVPNIFVTELQGFITASGASIDSQTTVLNQNVNLGLRGKISEKTLAGYNLFYTRQDNDPGNIARTQYTNGLYLNHTFDETFSASANGQRTDTTTDASGTTTEDIYNYTYGASLRANWLETFNQSLTFSGSYDDTEMGSSSQNALFLRNNAILYQGWSAFLDVGITREKPAMGSSIDSIIFRQGTSVQPNRQISLDLDLSYKRTTQSGQDSGPDSETRLDVQAFYVPFRNLSFFARINMVNREDSTDTFQNYSVNWSPFPDGDLQFFFVFNEIRLSENDQIQRIIGPSLKWTIGPHIFLDMSYNYTLNDSDTQEVKSNVFSSEIRMKF